MSTAERTQSNLTIDPFSWEAKLSATDSVLSKYINTEQLYAIRSRSRRRVSWSSIGSGAS